MLKPGDPAPDFAVGEATLHRLLEARRVVVGVSKDDQATSDRFRAALDLPYPLVGDPKGDILRAYDVRIPVLGLARRVTFVVGQDRLIEGLHESANGAESHLATACQLVLERPAATS